jgi:hypothetical protein
MAAADLDFLVAYADDRASFGPAHARWLADFPVHFEPACVLMPREGEPVMLVGPESDQYALLAGRIADVRVLRELTHPDEDYPFAEIQSLAEVMAEIGGTSGGAAGRPGRPRSDRSRPHGALQGRPARSRMGRRRELLCDLRSQKSPAELDVIRRAYEIAEVGIHAGIEAIAAGVTEREVAAEIERRCAGPAPRGPASTRSSPPDRTHGRSWPGPPSAASPPDDLVLLTVAPRYEGYHAAIGRVVLVGNPDPEIGRALETAIRAQQPPHRRHCAPAWKAAGGGRGRASWPTPAWAVLPLLGLPQRRRHRVRAADLRPQQPGDAQGEHGDLDRHPHVQHVPGAACGSKTATSSRPQARSRSVPCLQVRVRAVDARRRPSHGDVAAEDLIAPEGCGAATRQRSLSHAQSAATASISFGFSRHSAAATLALT